MNLICNYIHMFSYNSSQAKDTTLIHDNIWYQYEANLELNDSSSL